MRHPNWLTVKVRKILCSGSSGRDEVCRLSLRHSVGRLWGSLAFLCIYTAVWMLLLYAIYFLWDARPIFKIVANLVLVIFTPALSDIAEAWKERRKAE
jgi:cobalamin biosynthesis protein CobD/CbiB